MYQKISEWIDTRRNPSSIRSKSGGMLILVLLLMGVGLILITSAMSVTLSARERYYAEAQTSQARLTVTSTAKAFAEAITLTQEINDDEILALANSSGATGVGGAAIVKIYTADSSSQSAMPDTGSPVAPGLSDYGSDAYTIIRIYWTDATKDKIALDVTTKVDAMGGSSPASERVIVTLEEKPNLPPIDAFYGMVQAGTSGSSNGFFNCQIGTPGVDTPSNYVLLHGDWLVGSGNGIQAYSDVIFTGNVDTAAGTAYFNDVIFYGDDAGISNFGGNAMTPSGYLIFIGENVSQASVIRKDDGTPYGGSYTGGYNGGFYGAKGTYFYNTRFNGITEGMFGGTGNLYVHGGANFVDATSYELGSDRRVNLPAGNGTSVNPGNTWKTEAFVGDIKAAVEKLLPKPAPEPDFFSEVVARELRTKQEAVDLTGYAGVPAGAISLNSALNTDTNPANPYKAPAYYVNAGGAALTAHWIFDLSNNNIILYITGSGTFNISSAGDLGLIEFIKGGRFWGYIILTPGVNVTLNNDWNTGVFNGILSTGRDSSGPLAQVTAVTTTKPHLYIIGLGSNTFSATRMTVVEAYVGLYGNPEKGDPAGSGGNFIADNGPIIFGRIESYTYTNTSGDPFELPYCPAPGDVIVEPKQPLVSKYQIESYQYVQPLLS